MRNGKKMWATTRESNLLRNVPSGRYYARFTLSGKQIWRNLRTDIWSVAKLRLSDERSKIERTRQAGADVSIGSATVAQLIAIYRQRVKDRTDIAEKTKISALGSLDTVLKTWAGFDRLSPALVTRRGVIGWRNRITRDGTDWRPPGAKGPSAKTNGRSYSTANHSIDAIRQILDIAVEHGQLVTNPLHGRGVKVKRTPKKPKLPEASTLSAMFDEIEKRGGSGSRSRDAADFCRFLAYTGCRLSEAKMVTWGDVDFGRGILHIRGTKTAAADREVPLISAARQLLDKLHVRLAAQNLEIRGSAAVEPNARVVAVAEASKSLASACRKLRIEPLTHHDLRDAFATLAIEAGVDIPTVASWLGHADGGALLMKVYAHHRRAHSLAQAAKVTFGSAV
jgi:integrase